MNSAKLIALAEANWDLLLLLLLAVVIGGTAIRLFVAGSGEGRKREDRGRLAPPTREHIWATEQKVVDLETRVRNLEALTQRLEQERLRGGNDSRGGNDGRRLYQAAPLSASQGYEDEPRHTRRSPETVYGERVPSHAAAGGYRTSTPGFAAPRAPETTREIPPARAREAAGDVHQVRAPEPVDASPRAHAPTHQPDWPPPLSNVHAQSAPGPAPLRDPLDEPRTATLDVWRRLWRPGLDVASFTNHLHEVPGFAGAQQKEQMIWVQLVASGQSETLVLPIYHEAYNNERFYPLGSASRDAIITGVLKPAMLYGGRSEPEKGVAISEAT